MADAFFSFLQMNQVQDQGNYGVHHFKGLVTGVDHDLVNSAAAQGKHEYHNTDNPWLALDQDCHQEFSTPFYSISGNMAGIKEVPPPDSTAPSGLPWVQNDVQLHQRQQPIYDASAVATGHNSTNNHAEDITLYPHHLFQETIGKPLKDGTNPLTLTSLYLLTNYGKGMIKNIDPILGINLPVDDQTIHQRGPKNLSFVEILRVAGEKYVQLSTQKDDGFSMFMNNYSITTLDLSPEEAADVELLQLLLAAAENVGQRQFDIASLLISRCQWVTTDSGNAVQRIVFYFAESLQRRIDIEAGRSMQEMTFEQTDYAKRLEVDLACHEVIPLNQPMQFASVQAILDSIKTADKIHMVDLNIMSGIQWTILMQALAERNKLSTSLKISALTSNNEQHMEETGNRLKSFAESLNLHFTFNIVSVTEIKQLKEEMFKKETDEVVAVYSSIILRTMIPNPDSLRHLMRIIRRLRPVIVVVIEVEANHNSPSFVNRFTESLVFYGAFFDCMEDCMERDNQHRKIVEGVYLGIGIRNMVGTEGDKRCFRNVKLEVWREFFAWYGMEEMELSDNAVQHANLVLKKFPRADNSCTITQKGKGIVLKWKGTPLHSLSVWKFL